MTARAKNVLLAGLPGVGKTTLIQKLTARCRDRALTGFFTEEVREGGQRLGFRAVTLNGSSAVFAHRSYRTEPRFRVGRYGVKPEVLDSLVLPHLDPVRKHADLVVIDEIGKMELLSAAFKARVLEVLDSSCPVLATVPLLAAGFVKRVKERSDVELIRVTPANRDILADQVHRKLASLF